MELRRSWVSLHFLQLVLSTDATAVSPCKYVLIFKNTFEKVMQNETCKSLYMQVCIKEACVQRGSKLLFLFPSKLLYWIPAGLWLLSCTLCMLGGFQNWAEHFLWAFADDLWVFLPFAESIPNKVKATSTLWIACCAQRNCKGIVLFQLMQVWSKGPKQPLQVPSEGRKLLVHSSPSWGWNPSTLQSNSEES